MSLSIDSPELFNTELVKLVHKHPSLYDNTYKEYGSKEHREVQDISWAVIAAKLNECVPEIKKRWKNLRASFSRIVKFNTQYSLNNDEKRKRTYYLYDDMLFLLPYMKTKPLEDSVKIDVDVDVDLDIEEDDDEEEDIKPVVTMDGHNSTENSRANEQESEEDFPTTVHPTNGGATTAQTNTWIHNLPPKRRRYDDRFIQAPNETKKFALTSRSNEVPDNPDMDFFKCLQPDLQQMNLDEKREMKMKFLAVIDEIMKRKSK